MYDDEYGEEADEAEAQRVIDAEFDEYYHQMSHIPVEMPVRSSFEDAPF